MPSYEEKMKAMEASNPINRKRGNDGKGRGGNAYMDKIRGRIADTEEYKSTRTATEGEFGLEHINRLDMSKIDFGTSVGDKIANKYHSKVTGVLKRETKNIFGTEKKDKNNMERAREIMYDVADKFSLRDIFLPQSKEKPSPQTMGKLTEDLNQKADQYRSGGPASKGSGADPSIVVDKIADVMQTGENQAQPAGKEKKAHDGKEGYQTHQIYTATEKLKGDILGTKKGSENVVENVAIKMEMEKKLQELAGIKAQLEELTPDATTKEEKKTRQDIHETRRKLRKRQNEAEKRKNRAQTNIDIRNEASKDALGGSLEKMKAEREELKAEAKRETLDDVEKYTGYVSTGIGLAQKGVGGATSLSKFIHKETMEEGSEELQLAEDLHADVSGASKGIAEIATGYVDLLSHSSALLRDIDDLDTKDRWDRGIVLGKDIAAMGIGMGRAGGSVFGDNDGTKAYCNAIGDGMNVITDIVQLTTRSMRVSDMKDTMQDRKTQSKGSTGLKRSDQDKANGISRMDKALKSQADVGNKAYQEAMQGKEETDVEAIVAATKARKDAEDATRAKQVAYIRERTMQKTALGARQKEKSEAANNLAGSLITTLGSSLAAGFGLSSWQYSLTRYATKFAAKGIGFIVQKAYIDRNDKANQTKMINDYIESIKIEGGEQAARLGSVNSYDDLKKKFKVGYAIASANEIDGVRNLSDSDFKTLMSAALCGEEFAGGRQGLINALSTQNAKDLADGHYDSFDQEGNKTGTSQDAFLRASGVVRGKEGQLPREEVLAQRMGQRGLDKGVYKHSDELKRKEERHKAVRTAKIAQLSKMIAEQETDDKLKAQEKIRAQEDAKAAQLAKIKSVQKRDTPGTGEDFNREIKNAEQMKALKPRMVE